MHKLAAITFFAIFYVGHVATDECIPIFVRWSRVKISLAAKQSGPFTLQECADACAKNQPPPGVSSLTLKDCAGFNHKQGTNSLANDCQLYENDPKINIDDHVEADDRFSFYWKYCADKFYFSDPSKKNCKSIYHFDFHIDRYMDQADVERTIRTDRLEDCLNRCLDEPAFICRSASFNRTGRLCSLSPQSQVTKPSSLRVNNNPNFRIDYYESSCVNASVSFEFRHDCRANGVVVSVESKFPYSGAMYGLYDFFTCRIEPKDETKFAYFFPKPNYSKNCSDSFSQKDGHDVLNIVLSTDGMEPLYFLTDQDTMYQVKCPISDEGFSSTPANFIDFGGNSTPEKEISTSTNTNTSDFLTKNLTLHSNNEEPPTLEQSPSTENAASPTEITPAVSRELFIETEHANNSTKIKISGGGGSTEIHKYSLTIRSGAARHSTASADPQHIIVTNLQYSESPGYSNHTTAISWTFPHDADTAPAGPPSPSTLSGRTAPDAAAVLDLSPIFAKVTLSSDAATSPHSGVTVGPATSSGTVNYADLVVTPTRGTFSPEPPSTVSNALTVDSSLRPFFEASTLQVDPLFTEIYNSTFLNRRKVDYTTPPPSHRRTIFTVPDDQPPSSTVSSTDKASEPSTSTYNPWRKGFSEKSPNSIESSTSKFQTFIFELPSTANAEDTTIKAVSSTDSFLNNEFLSSSKIPSVSRLSENTTANGSMSSGSLLGTTTEAPAKQGVRLEIYHNNQPVNAVVVASRIVLSLSPSLPLPPGTYVNVIGCQVEPINSPYASERDPIQIISGGCQADGVGLVCPPIRVDSGEKIEMEALRYTHTSEILFSCLVRICSLGRCLQPICRPVDGCFSVSLAGNPSQFPFRFQNGAGFGGFKNLALQRTKRQNFPDANAQPFLPLVPAFEVPGAFQQSRGGSFPQQNQPRILQGSRQNQSPNLSPFQGPVSGQGQGLSPDLGPYGLLPQDAVVSKKLVVVNTEAELQYFLRTGSVPSRGTISGNNNFNGFIQR